LIADLNAIPTQGSFVLDPGCSSGLVRKISMESTACGWPEKHESPQPRGRGLCVKRACQAGSVFGRCVVRANKNRIRPSSPGQRLAAVFAVPDGPPLQGLAGSGTVRNVTDQTHATPRSMPELGCESPVTKDWARTCHGRGPSAQRRHPPSPVPRTPFGSDSSASGDHVRLDLLVSQLRQVVGAGGVLQGHAWRPIRVFTGRNWGAKSVRIAAIAT
jgi:hypothetical protein